MILSHYFYVYAVMIDRTKLLLLLLPLLRLVLLLLLVYFIPYISDFRLLIITAHTNYRFMFRNLMRVSYTYHSFAWGLHFVIWRIFSESRTHICRIEDIRINCVNRIILWKTKFYHISIGKGQKSKSFCRKLLFHFSSHLDFKLKILIFLSVPVLLFSWR